MKTPHHLTLSLRFRAPALPELVDVVLSAWAAAGWPAPTGWTTKHARKVTPGGERPAALRVGTKRAPATEARFECSDGVRCIFYPDETAPQPDTWVVEVRLGDDALTADTVAEHTRRLAKLCRLLLPDERLVGGSSRRKGGGGPENNLLPDVPLASCQTQIVITDTSTVAASYEDPSAFWRSWTVERRGEVALCTRGLDAVSGLDLVLAIRDGQWEMARAAKPGGCSLYSPNPSDEERSAFIDSEPTLRMVGYLRDEATVELACAITDDTHVSGWEIMQMFSLVEAKEDDEGRPVKHVRVAFLDEEVARRERRPLLDGGIQVFYYDAGGALVPITD